MNRSTVTQAKLGYGVAPHPDELGAVLTEPALDFLYTLVRECGPALGVLLEARRQRPAADRLDFSPETAAVREGSWRCAPIPRDLEQRIVEITGPVDRKMVINALNSGADVFMADFEDATSPTWENVLRGQLNLMDAVRRDIRHVDPITGKVYELGGKPATLMVRSRGLHLRERHVTIDGQSVPGCLFDFALYFFHNAAALLAMGSGPYFYLPKLESHLEARWWNHVFICAQDRLGIPRGSIRATVLIETLPAAFCMDEILYELRHHSAGLNCGRWDYIFSYIKVNANSAVAAIPDRAEVTMTQPFMRAYTQLVVRTCHRRGVHAIGGMAAQVPIKGNDAANNAAFDRVRADKAREVADGHDGTWVAHPGLVGVARETFRAHMNGPNQLDRTRDDVTVTRENLLEPPVGARTEAGLRLDIRVAIRYLESWLRGTGCVPLYHLMEDAATAEISRAQVWGWLRHGATLEDGRVVTRSLVESTVADEMTRIASEVGPDLFAGGRFDEARALFESLCYAETMAPFLTLGAYELI
jgi:malate synthase